MSRNRKDTPRARRRARSRQRGTDSRLAGLLGRSTPGNVFRSLCVEELEPRLACTASPVGEAVSPEWFADYSSQFGLEHAGAAGWSATAAGSHQATAAATPGVSDWIVRFNASALGSITSAAGTSVLFASSGIHFDVICGLGLTGQVLVRSSGASPDAVSAWLAADRQIAGFEADSVQQFAMIPNDPRLSQLWGLGAATQAGINAQAAWNVTTGSKNVVVAVVDTGVDFTHPDLAANIWTNPREIAGNGADDDHDGFVDDLHGYDFANDDANPMDDQGHGTHVAGILGAAGNNGVGVTGVNWSVSIMPLKFLDATGEGFTSDAVRAINYATMMRTTYGVNLRVINMSWGGSSYSASLHDSIQAAGNAGILVVAAAGNDASDNDAKPSYPASYDCANLLTVAATNTQDQLAYFSNWGANSVDLAAPGYQILSTIPNASYASYSGTSMATPYVSGVAALSWALAPDASVAQVRTAILQGVDHLPSLAGRVASGGRLDAYNTLQLLRATGPLPPSVAALAIAPGTITAGGHPTLTASGVADPDGTVAAVSFYLDTNGNHQWDAGDRLLGTTTTIQNNSAAWTIDTTGFAPGTYTVFARARDGQSLWSPAVSASMAIVAADDHGNDPTTATLVGVASTTSGVIETGGDQDWFAIQAAASRTYTFDTTLRTLSDSTLALYGRDGTTRLAFNDDWGTSYASHVAWKAPVSGTYYVVVSAYGKSMTGSYALRVVSDQPAPNVAPTPASNAAPTLSSIADQTIPAGQHALNVNLSASDPDGDRLTYTATLAAADPLVQQAYNLDQQLGLSYAGSYYRNLRGYQEEWIRGSGGLWYCLMPSGEFRRWTGIMASSPVVATLSPAYYADPQLLLGAKPIGAGDVALSLNGSTLSIAPRSGLTGNFSVQVAVSDGQHSVSRAFHVTIAAANSTLSLASVGPAVPASPAAGHAVDRVIGGDFLLEALLAWRPQGANFASSGPHALAISDLDAFAPLDLQPLTLSPIHAVTPSSPDPSRLDLVAPQAAAGDLDNQARDDLPALVDDARAATSDLAAMGEP